MLRSCLYWICLKKLSVGHAHSQNEITMFLEDRAKDKQSHVCAYVVQKIYMAITNDVFGFLGGEEETTCMVCTTSFSTSDSSMCKLRSSALHKDCRVLALDQDSFFLYGLSATKATKSY